MNLYDAIMRPLEAKLLCELRQALVKSAQGDVLEIGIGTGVNLPYYNPDDINRIIGVDIRLTDNIKRIKDDRLSLLETSAEKLPFEDNSFDTVVATLVLCSVGDVKTALSEIKRVLKPLGKYIFIEHILPEKTGIAWVFTRINPLWSRFTYGCNLNRRTDILIQKGGFSSVSIRKKGKSIFCYGTARK